MRSTPASNRLRRVLITLGVLAAFLGLLIYSAKAYRDARRNALSLAIRANLERIALAARDHLRQTGAAEARYPDFSPRIGSPLTPYAGEDYKTLTVTPQTRTLTVTAYRGWRAEYHIPPGFWEAPSQGTAAAAAPTAGTR